MPAHNHLTRYSRRGRVLGTADLGDVDPEDTSLVDASWSGTGLAYATEPGDRDAPCVRHGAAVGAPPDCHVFLAAPSVRP